MIVNARAQGNVISKVEFYAEGALLGSGVAVGGDSFVFTWPNASDGIHSLTVVATDDLGLRTTSTPVNIAVNTTLGVVPGQLNWFDDAAPQGATALGDGETWHWVDANPGSFSGQKAHQSRNFVQLETVHQHYFLNATQKLPVNVGDKLFTYIFLDINNMPRQIMLQWHDGNNWDHRAYWGQNQINFGTDGTESRRYMGSLPRAGQWVRLEVPASAVGLEGRTLSGMAFTLAGGRATWDLAGKTTANAPPRPTTPPGDLVWLEDDLPAGAIPAVIDDHWNWVPGPVNSGQTAHQSFFRSNDDKKYRSHSFTGAQTPLVVNPGDVLFTYVYLGDPDLNHQPFKPDQIMLQWYDGASWEHRAFWGENYIGQQIPNAGVQGTEGQRYMGGLPEARGWYRLEVPASYVGLEGKSVSGMAFSVFRNGKNPFVTWDRSGKSAQLTTVPLPLSAATGVWLSKSPTLGYAFETNDHGVPDHFPQQVNWFYAYPNQAAGTEPFYRFRHPQKHEYFYSRHRNAHPSWEFAGIAFYVYPDGSTPGTVPLHLFHDITTSHYYLTTNRTELPGMIYDNIWAYVNETNLVAPSPPSYLHFDGILRWKDNSANETGFKIERSDFPGLWNQIATVPVNTTVLKIGTGWGGSDFRVRATNSFGDSAFSNSACGCFMEFIDSIDTAPEIYITSPVNGDVVAGDLTVSINVFDNNGAGTIAKVEFYVDGNKLAEADEAPYWFVWNNAPPGPHSLTAVATDTAGGTRTSSPVNVTVSSTPTVSIASPAPGAFFDALATVTITTSASSPGASISKVEFFQSLTKLGETATAPYSFTWSNVAAGSYSLTAKVTDNLGATSLSDTINITVNDSNVPPTVSVTIPTSGAVFTALASISINATASDSDGTVSKVEFFQGSTKLGEDTTAPYSFDWTNAPAGSYSLTARVTDNLGAISISSAVNVTVSAANQPPVVHVGGPYSGTAGTAVEFDGSGSSDPDGTIAAYSWNFGDGGTASGFTPWHVYTAAGTYTATLTVTDNNGAQSAASAPVTISGGSANTNGYIYRRSITLDHTKVPNTDQFAFPVLISGTFPYLATASNGGFVRNANGYDVIFTSDLGCATKLNHEVETYRYLSGAVNFWVNVPTVSSTSDTVIYMCYGNPAVTTDQSNKTAVWDSNYKGVWHMPNGTTLSAADSTANANHGAISGPIAAAGRIDGGSSSFNTADHINAGSGASLNITGSLTIAAWIKMNTFGVGGRSPIVATLSSATAGYALLAGDGGGASKFIGFAPMSNGNVAVRQNVVEVGSWYYVVVVSNGANPTFYVNGANVGTGSAIVSNPSAGSLYLGNYFTLVKGFDGLMDEVRVSNAQRTADWIATEYNNQSSPATFYQISAASVSNQPPVVNAGGPYSGTAGTAVQFNGSDSSDSDGWIVTFAWNFGDGSSGSGPTPLHTYSAAGDYTVTLTLTDNNGAQSSATSPVTLNSNTPPTVSVTAPTNGAVFTAPASFTISVSASDGDGFINKVEFFQGSIKLDEDVTPPYSLNWTNVAAGSYSLTAKATDNLGATRMSGAVNVTVSAANQPPTANAGGPYSGTVGTAVQFNGSASHDPDGAITSYVWNFGDGGTGSGATSSHTYTTVGAYNVTLTVTDNSGASRSVSATVTINAANTGADVVWVEDAVPAGATLSGNSEGWNWVSSNPAPVSGTVSHQSEPVNGFHQHYFYNATNTLTVNTGDNLFAYVYLDPANPPSQVMLQWNDGIWDHRAYWGTNNIGSGTDGTDSRRYMGALPGAGGWVRLEVAASAVGLEGHTLNGMAFTLWNGRAIWDRAGKSSGVGSGPPTAGLVGYWKFDESSGASAADSSASGTHGTLVNGPTWTTGRSGSALNFDGADDMVSSSGLANVTNNFTLSFWALPSATHEIDAETAPGFGGVSGQRYAFWPAWYDGGHCGVGVSVGINGVGVYEHAANYMPATLVHAATLSGWTHITIVYENRQPKLYLNGILVKTGLTSPMSIVHMNPNNIGGQVYGYYAGKLDEIRVYNRVLTATEVAALPNSSYSANAATDSSATQNPTGNWSYGYKSTSGSFTLYSGTSTIFGAGTTTWALGQTCCPMVTRNNTGATLTYPVVPSVVQPADVLALHPGSNNERSIVRWTAPAAGTYSIEGRFQGIDTSGTTTDVLVTHNGMTLFSGNVNGYTNTAPFSLTRIVGAGDTIEFSVGYGSNGTYNSDSTGLSAIITTSGRKNVALSASGAVASASSTYNANYPASGANNGDRKLGHGSGGTWHSSTNTFPQWLQIDFNGTKTIDEVDVFTLQDSYASPPEPTDAMTFTLYGLTGFEVQYWNGSTWATVPGGSISANNKVWRKITFASITTSKIRVLTNGSVDGWTRITEVEAWGTPTGSIGDSGTNGYAYRRSITIDRNKVANTDQSNFPVLISDTYSYLATVGNGGNVQNANGYDVVFTSDSGCTNKLNHEVETYNAANGAVNYWVKVPTLSRTSDSVFYMCYGNASINTDQSNKTAVWDSSYKGVWHLPNGTSLSTTDSTANANNASSNSASATAGRIDGAASYNGAGQSTVITNPANFDFEHNQPFSVELWLKKPFDTVNNQILVSKKNTYWTGAGFNVWTWAGSNQAFFAIMDTAGTWFDVGSVVNVQDNAWHHIVCTYDGSSNRSGMKMYVDGILMSTGSPLAIPNTIRNTYDLNFGTNSVSKADFYNGTLDEVRFSSSSRSADWIKTEYNNQSSPATFYMISASSGGQ